MLDSRDPQLPEALIRASLSIYDPEWLQRTLLESLAIEDDQVKYASLLGIGHVARIHRRLDLETVIPLLEKYRKHPKVGGTAENTLSDIEIFMLRPFQKKTRCRTPKS